MTDKQLQKAEQEIKKQYDLEVKRVQGIAKEFFAEYGELCKKHKAQIVPKIISNPTDMLGFKIQLFLAPYTPLEHDENETKTA